MPKAKKKKESWVARLKKKVRKELDKRKEEKGKKKKEFETARTKRVKEELRKAGLSKADVKKLQDKKKKKNNPHKKSGGY